MKLAKTLMFLFLLLIGVNVSFAGNVTITLVGHDPLTVNVKGTTVDEEAAGLSIFIYFNSSSPADATTNLSASNVNSTLLTNTFGWNFLETKVVETGSWLKNGVTYSSRLNYALTNLGTGNNDIWPTSGVNALILDFNPGGPGSAYIELMGSDGVPNYSAVGHVVEFVNQTVSPLPVELSSFTASVSQNSVTLSWITQTELNNYGFEVERASSTTSPIQGWEKIGFVAGNGNSNSPKDYSFIDFSPSGGSKFIYRLKQIDNNGKFEYSDEVEIDLTPSEFVLYQNYPNPFNPSTKIQYALSSQQYTTLKVYDVLGNEMQTLVDEVKPAGLYEVTVDAANLPSGIYFYKLRVGAIVETKKMTLLR